MKSEIKKNSQEKLIQCLFCEKYLGWSNQSKKKILKVCDGICLENLTKYLDQELNERAKSKVKSWQNIIQKEEEWVIFTGKQYQDLVNNAQELEKGKNIPNSARNISQLLMDGRK